MNTMKLGSRSKLSGQGLVLILIVLAILVGLWWYLHSTKASTEQDGIRYGHDVINRLVINHDRSGSRRTGKNGNAAVATGLPDSTLRSIRFADPTNPD